MIFLICASVLVCATYIYLRGIYSRFSSYEVKHIKPVPFLGNMLPALWYKIHNLDAFDRFYKTFSGERFAGRYKFLTPVIVLRDLELIKKVTIKDYEYFTDHKSLMDPEIEPIYGRNLFSLKGEEWKDLRSALSPGFTSAHIHLMVPFMVEVGDQMLIFLRKNFEANNGKPMDVNCDDLSTRFTNDVLASCIFGLKINSYNDDNSEFYRMTYNASDFKGRQILILLMYNAFPSIVKLLKLTVFSKETRNFFTRLVLDTIHHRETHNIVRHDMINILMKAKKGQLKHDKNLKNKKQDAGFATVEESFVESRGSQREWSDDDLIAQALVTYLAGFHTTSVNMCFILRELALHPEAQEKLAKEIQNDSLKNGGKIDYSSMHSLPYLDMVVAEALRLWPTGFLLDRECTKDYNLGKPNDKTNKDYIIRKGEQVMIPLWSIQRDPEYYPEPDKFDPERFSNENKHKIKPMAYMPFGAGPRNCVGARFALFLIKMWVYQLLLHWQVSPSEKTVKTPKFSLKSFNLAIEGGHWLDFTPREKDMAT